MRPPKPRRPSRTAQFLQTYTNGLTREDVQRLFTRDAREAYRFFARSMDEDALGRIPWHRRAAVRARLISRPSPLMPRRSHPATSGRIWPCA